MTWPAAPDLLAPLVPWFEGNRRELPWRAPDLDLPHPDPYAVLVSELMLQQTQVATVVPYFRRWLEQFPTPQALAAASDDAVHKAWEGLGYYRRARFLKAAATRIASTGWPRDLAGLLALPGLGPYTAAAVGAIAFQWPTPALDGNGFRVLARLLLLEGDPRAAAAELRSWLAPALVAHGSSRLTQALMELGATHCAPTPACGACPLQAACKARHTDRTNDIPPMARRPKVRESDLWLLAVEAEGHLLLHPPRERGLLAGLWHWPSLEAGDLLPEAPCPVPGPVRTWPSWTQVYTHRRERVRPVHLLCGCRFEPASGLTWVAISDLPGLPLGRRDQRLRDLLGSAGSGPQRAPAPEALLGGLRADAAPAG